MTINDEKLLVKNAIAKVVELDEETKRYCKYESEFEFYSMYDSVVRDLWKCTNASFDSWEEFLNYCNDCKQETLNLQAAKFWSDYVIKQGINKRKEKLFDLD